MTIMAAEAPSDSSHVAVLEAGHGWLLLKMDLASQVLPPGAAHACLFGRAVGPTDTAPVRMRVTDTQPLGTGIAYPIHQGVVDIRIRVDELDPKAHYAFAIGILDHKDGLLCMLPATPLLRAHPPWAVAEVWLRLAASPGATAAHRQQALAALRALPPSEPRDAALARALMLVHAPECSPQTPLQPVPLLATASQLRQAARLAISAADWPLTTRALALVFNALAPFMFHGVAAPPVNSMISWWLNVIGTLANAAVAAAAPPSTAHNSPSPLPSSSWPFLLSLSSSSSSPSFVTEFLGPRMGHALGAVVFFARARGLSVVEEPALLTLLERLSPSLSLALAEHHEVRQRLVAVTAPIPLQHAFENALLRRADRGFLRETTRILQRGLELGLHDRVREWAHEALQAASLAKSIGATPVISSPSRANAAASQASVRSYVERHALDFSTDEALRKQQTDALHRLSLVLPEYLRVMRVRHRQRTKRLERADPLHAGAIRLLAAQACGLAHVDDALAHLRRAAVLAARAGAWRLATNAAVALLNVAKEVPVAAAATSGGATATQRAVAKAFVVVVDALLSRPAEGDAAAPQTTEAFGAGAAQTAAAVTAALVQQAVRWSLRLGRLGRAVDIGRHAAARSALSIEAFSLVVDAARTLDPEDQSLPALQAEALKRLGMSEMLLLAGRDGLLVEPVDHALALDKYTRLLALQPPAPAAKALMAANELGSLLASQGQRAAAARAWAGGVTGLLRLPTTDALPMRWRTDADGSARRLPLQEIAPSLRLAVVPVLSKLLTWGYAGNVTAQNAVACLAAHVLASLDADTTWRDLTDLTDRFSAGGAALAPALLSVARHLAGIGQASDALLVAGHLGHLADVMQNRAYTAKATALRAQCLAELGRMAEASQLLLKPPATPMPPFCAGEPLCDLQNVQHLLMLGEGGLVDGDAPGAVHMAAGMLLLTALDRFTAGSVPPPPGRARRARSSQAPAASSASRQTASRAQSARSSSSVQQQQMPTANAGQGSAVRDLVRLAQWHFGQTDPEDAVPVSCALARLAVHEGNARQAVSLLRAPSTSAEAGIWLFGVWRLAEALYQSCAFAEAARVCRAALADAQRVQAEAVALLLQLVLADCCRVQGESDPGPVPLVPPWVMRESLSACEHARAALAVQPANPLELVVAKRRLEEEILCHLFVEQDEAGALPGGKDDEGPHEGPHPLVVEYLGRPAGLVCRSAPQLGLLAQVYGRASAGKDSLVAALALVRLARPDLRNLEGRTALALARLDGARHSARMDRLLLLCLPSGTGDLKGAEALLVHAMQCLLHGDLDWACFLEACELLFSVARSSETALLAAGAAAGALRAQANTRHPPRLLLECLPSAATAHAGNDELLHRATVDPSKQGDLKALLALRVSLERARPLAPMLGAALRTVHDHLASHVPVFAAECHMEPNALKELGMLAKSKWCCCLFWHVQGAAVELRAALVQPKVGATHGTWRLSAQEQLSGLLLHAAGSQTLLQDLRALLVPEAPAREAPPCPPLAALRSCFHLTGGHVSTDAALVAAMAFVLGMERK